MRLIEVTPYNDGWIAMFEEEAKTICEIFGSELVGIHHIGSTAVPGLYAKPTIDIMPVVKDIQSVDDFTRAMVSIGYVPRGENGMEGRRYFHKGGDRRTHHVHFYEVGNSEIERHITFRDYLRTHPEDAQRYGALKQGVLPTTPGNYTSGAPALYLDYEFHLTKYEGKWLIDGTDLDAAMSRLSDVSPW